MTSNVTSLVPSGRIWTFGASLNVPGSGLSSALRISAVRRILEPVVHILWKLSRNVAFGAKCVHKVPKSERSADCTAASGRIFSASIFSAQTWPSSSGRTWRPLTGSMGWPMSKLGAISGRIRSRNRRVRTFPGSALSEVFLSETTVWAKVTQFHRRK